MAEERSEWVLECKAGLNVKGIGWSEAVEWAEGNAFQAKRQKRSVVFRRHCTPFIVVVVDVQHGVIYFAEFTQTSAEVIQQLAKQIDEKYLFLKKTLEWNATLRFYFVNSVGLDEQIVALN